MAEPLRFYGNGTPFSNFAAIPIIVDSLEYSTTEHYFQSMKFIATDPDFAEEIRLAPTPFKAKMLGKSRQHPWVGVEAWNRQRDDVMRTALFAKAIQNPSFMEELLATGDVDMIEAAPRDYYWGEGAKKTGKNMLGKLLVELREKLKEHVHTLYQK